MRPRRATWRLNTSSLRRLPGTSGPKPHPVAQTQMPPPVHATMAHGPHPPTTAIDLDKEPLSSPVDASGPSRISYRRRLTHRQARGAKGRSLTSPPWYMTRTSQPLSKSRRSPGDACLLPNHCQLVSSSWRPRTAASPAHLDTRLGCGTTTTPTTRFGPLPTLHAWNFKFFQRDPPRRHLDTLSFLPWLIHDLTRPLGTPPPTPSQG